MLPPDTGILGEGLKEQQPIKRRKVRKDERKYERGRKKVRILAV